MCFLRCSINSWSFSNQIPATWWEGLHLSWPHLPQLAPLEMRGSGGTLPTQQRFLLRLDFRLCWRCMSYVILASLGVSEEPRGDAFWVIITHWLVWSLWHKSKGISLSPPKICWTSASIVHLCSPLNFFPLWGKKPVMCTSLEIWFVTEVLYFNCWFQTLFFQHLNPALLIWSLPDLRIYSSS